MKKNFLVSIVVAALVVAASLTTPAPARAQVTSQGGKYLLRMKWQKGKSYSFVLNMRMATAAGKGAPQGFKSGYSYQVTNVANGVATLSATAQSPTGGAPTHDTIKVDSKGHMIAKPTKLGGNAIEFQSFPDKPVSIGESWSGVVQTNSGQMGRISVSNKDTLKSVKMVGGRKVAEIGVVTTVKGATVTGTGVGTMMLDASDGMVISYSQNMSMTANAGGKPMKIGTIMTITRK